jgi:site-specific recombinase XerD
MFDRLFSYPKTIARHRDAPLADARERYLAHCADKCLPQSTLCKIAWQLLVVVRTVDVRDRRVSIEEIKRAATKPAVFCQRVRTEPGFSPISTQQCFVRVATGWLRFLGRLQKPRTEGGSFTRQIRAFRQYMQCERGLSPVTIQTRCERLEWFMASVPVQRRTVREISVADVDAFLASKGAAGWSRASLSVLAGSLRSFFLYAQARHWCNDSIAAAIEGPRIFAQESLPRGASWEEVERLLVSSNGDGDSDIRAHAILMLLALYGLRAGEVSRLCVDDIDWDHEIVSIKRPKQRCVQQYPWAAAAGNAVLRYVREVRFSRSSHRELFLTLKAPYRPLSSQSVTAIVHARLVSVESTLTRRGAHSLRHACAAHLLASDFSFKEIGDHLGHRSANSAFYYAKVDLAGLRQVAELDLGALL